MFKQVSIVGFGCNSFFACIILMLGLTSTPAFSAEREIAWTEDYEAAVQQAASTNSIVLLHFYGESCPPCKLLDRKTFHDPSLVAAINENVVPVKINADKRRDLATKYNVNRWPTDVYLCSNGDELYRGVSDQDPAVYTKKIQRIALRHRDWSLERESIAKNTQRGNANAHLANAPQTQPEKTAYAGTISHPTKSQAASWTDNSDAHRYTQSALLPVAQARPLKQQRVIDNPYLAQQPIEVPAANAVKVLPSQVTPGEQSKQTYNATPSVGVPEESSSKAQGVFVKATGLQRPVSDESLSQNQAIEQPNSPLHVIAETVGLGGYCPVTLVESIGRLNDAVWVRGSASFAVRHRGRVYHCASEQSRQTLLGEPDRYTPCLSGFDLVHFFTTGLLIDGKCEFGCIQPKTNRVYLFADAANYHEFERDNERFSRLLDSVTPERVAGRSSETQNR